VSDAGSGVRCTIEAAPLEHCVFMVQSISRAPKRGEYDRTLSQGQRDAQHRERLLKAATDVALHGPLTVVKVAARAGVGRATFYEFFDGPEHVLGEVEQRFVRALDEACRAESVRARTPVERVRALSRGWFLALATRKAEATVTFCCRPRAAPITPAGELFKGWLERLGDSARRDVGWSKANDSVNVLAAVAAAEALARSALTEGEAPDTARVLSELILRLLR
jgi:AcrR family transcriptional regulator